METAIWAIIVTLIAAVAHAIGAYYFKKGVSHLSFSWRKILHNKTLKKGAYYYGLSALISVPPLRYGQLSVLYPLMATAYIWVAILGCKYMKEKMTIAKYFGIAMIVLGVLFIGLGM